MSDIKINSIGNGNETKQHPLSLPNEKNQNHSLQATVQCENNKVAEQVMEDILPFNKEYSIA